MPGSRGWHGWVTCTQPHSQVSTPCLRSYPPGNPTVLRQQWCSEAAVVVVFFFFSWATGWKWLLWLVCFSEQGRSLSHWGCYWGGWLLEDISCTCFLSKAVFPSQTVFVYWRSYTTHLHLWLVLAAHFSYCVSKLHQHFHCKHACKDLVAHCCLCRRTAIPAEGATAVVGPGFCPKTQGLAWLVLLKELFAGNKRALAQHSMLTYVLTEVNAEQVWLTRQLSEHGPLSEGTPTVAGCRGSGS